MRMGFASLLGPDAGETVEVVRHTVSRDAYGRQVDSETSETAANVIVTPINLNTNTADVPKLPDSVEIQAMFPKSFTGSLENATIRRSDGTMWDVVGSPQEWPAAVTPTQWNRHVWLSRAVR